MHILLKRLLLISLVFLASSCNKEKPKSENPAPAPAPAPPPPSEGSGIGNITNVHAPTSGSDSIKFTADTSQIHLSIFSPLGGANHVIVRNMTSGINLLDTTVTSIDQYVSGFIATNNYAIICYSGNSTTNFTHASSSFRNSGATPTPFTGYTQYYNNSSGPGPVDGVVVIIMGENQSSSY